MPKPDKKLPDQKMHKEAVDETYEHLDEIIKGGAPFILMSMATDDDGDIGVKTTGVTQNPHIALFKQALAAHLEAPEPNMDNVLEILEKALGLKVRKVEMTEDGLRDMAGLKEEEDEEKDDCECPLCQIRRDLMDGHSLHKH